MYKWNCKSRQIATYFITFMDDIRVICDSQVACTRGMYRIAMLTNYLGEQHAAIKWRNPAQSPGLWAGVSMETYNENIYVSTSQDKWDK